MTLDQYLLAAADAAADAHKIAAAKMTTHQPRAMRATHQPRRANADPSPSQHRPQSEPTPSQAEADTEPTPTHQPRAMMGGGGCAAAAPNRQRNELKTDSVLTPYQLRVQRAHAHSRHPGETIKTRLQ